MSEAEAPQWIIVQLPKMVPKRKGPYMDAQQIESALRELYGIHADCVCTVVRMPHDSYPQSGKEWLDFYGSQTPNISIHA